MSGSGTRVMGTLVVLRVMGTPEKATMGQVIVEGRTVGRLAAEVNMKT